MWFAQWERLSYRRRAKGKSAPNPLDPKIRQQVQAIAELLPLRDTLEKHLNQAGDGTDAEQLRAQIEKTQCLISTLMTLENCFCEMHWHLVEVQKELRLGLIDLGRRISASPNEMMQLLDRCEQAVVGLPQWDQSPDLEMGRQKLLELLSSFYYEVVRPMKILQDAAELVGVRDCSPLPETEGSEEHAPIPATALEQIVEAIGDDTTVQIVAIANRADLTVDTRMKLIAQIDRRFKRKTSQEWANMLNKSDGAVRKTDAWRNFQKEKTEE